ncbi:ABC transporter ATP-binding protein [Pediococcus pentosaceus]|uniref:ABC transporter ATP-binding protein n=1 Tax=Pediococcus pentosaceus TaxID=1255 RepID=UPI0021A3976B|nr:ATP-binding cassette domain-containing protein [Pediococcus pentosaceus]MCT3033277.1 ATP-binding cassette domain-containing protein [Pediococcus pentosaceus]
MLKVDDINVYVGHKKIIKTMSFKVMPGAIVGLVGPNGAGKTTIMKTILGLTKFDGQIMIDDAHVTNNDHAPLADVGALIEHPAIYPFLSGLQNLELYSRDRHDMWTLIQRLQMESYIKNKAKSYSLGMKQKLGIAIALLNHPKLVILDEPMNGLDVEATIFIRKVIKEYADLGTAFLISSHVLSELQKVMTEVILINHGELVIDKNVDEFNKVSRQNYKLVSEDLSEIGELLEAEKIFFTHNGNYLEVQQRDIYNIQDILATHHLHFEELAPMDANFEQIIVSLLNKQRRVENAQEFK